MNLPFIDRIWRVRGFLPLDPPQSPEEAFGKLDPLFKANGTTYEVNGDTLTYKKDNPAAQDKMATFTSGTLQVVSEGGVSKLFYNLFSPALLACFLAPLLFIGFGQLFEFLNVIEGPATEEARDAEDTSDEEEPQAELHWIDQMLGAPQPEDPNAEDEEDEKEEEEEDKGGKHSSTPSYVLAGLFAALYLAGRALEPWLIRRTFRRHLSGEAEADNSEANGQDEAQQPG